MVEVPDSRWSGSSALCTQLAQAQEIHALIYGSLLRQHGAGILGKKYIRIEYQRRGKFSRETNGFKARSNTNCGKILL
jgi:hypothetical protein